VTGYDSIEKAIEFFTSSILTPEKNLEKEQEKFSKSLDISTFKIHDDMKRYLMRRWRLVK
jgi:hypothetical protein